MVDGYDWSDETHVDPGNDQYILKNSDAATLACSRTGKQQLKGRTANRQNFFVKSRSQEIEEIYWRRRCIEIKPDSFSFIAAVWLLA